MYSTLIISLEILILKQEHSKQYETIKIQTGKLNNMQAFADFVKNCRT